MPEIDQTAPDPAVAGQEANATQTTPAELPPEQPPAEEPPTPGGKDEAPEPVDPSIALRAAFEAPGHAVGDAIGPLNHHGAVRSEPQYRWRRARYSIQAYRRRWPVAAQPAQSADLL